MEPNSEILRIHAWLNASIQVLINLKWSKLMRLPIYEIQFEKGNGVPKQPEKTQMYRNLMICETNKCSN